MSANDSTVAAVATDDNAYAALCVWEEMLAIKARNATEHHGLLRHWERVGTCALRHTALSLGSFANVVWRALDDALREALEPFDWEFVPALLSIIRFDGPGPCVPSVEAAIADLQRFVATRPVAGHNSAEASPSRRAAPGSRLFLVAYEADGKPYAVALSDLDAAHAIARAGNGEVIDTEVDRHADMAPAQKTYAVEVTWRVPEYVHLTVEANSADEARAKALAEVADHPDRFERKLDYETCGPDEVTGIWEGDEAYPDRRDRSRPTCAPDEGSIVFVARYQSRHGDVETRACRSEFAALAWKDEIARSNWDVARDGVAPDTIGDVYFELQHDRGEESFCVDRCRLV